MPLCVTTTFLRDTFLTSYQSKAIGSRAGRSLLPFEILDIVDRELTTKKFASDCTAAYLDTIRAFVTHQVANWIGEMRRSRGMFDALERNGDWDVCTDLSLGASGAQFIV